MSFTPDEIDYLSANELPRRRWLYSSNAKPIIDACIDRGLMQFASGKFRLLPPSGETVQLLGRAVPVETMVSLCMLTPHGRDALPAPAAAE